MKLPFSVGLMVLVMGSFSSVRAEVVATGIVPGEGIAPRAVLHAQGVTIPVDGSPPLLACATLAQNVDMQGLLWTGDDNLLVFGTDGPWLTDTYGCHWVATFGPVSERRVVAAYQREPGDKRVLFAVGGDLGVTGVMVTEDGGFTSQVLAGLSFGELDLVGLAGTADTVGILGQEPDGSLRGWSSLDGGLSFDERGMPDDVPVSEVRLGAVDASGVWWVWLDHTLHRLDPDGAALQEERTFEDGPNPMSVSPLGELWVAGGEEGLWRRAPAGGWERALVDVTTAVNATDGPCWAGHPAASPGAPLVRWSNDGGETWSIPLVAPDVWEFSPGCETSASQVCAPDIATLWPGEETPSDPAPAVQGSGCAAHFSTPETLWGALFLLMWPLMILVFRRCNLDAGRFWFIRTP